ncbi:MAG TPA: carboxypeptidase-like regulatory domain-containing protein, partial [Verrucomicrobiae bacterium]
RTRLGPVATGCTVAVLAAALANHAVAAAPTALLAHWQSLATSPVPAIIPRPIWVKAPAITLVSSLVLLLLLGWSLRLKPPPPAAPANQTAEHPAPTVPANIQLPETVTASAVVVHARPVKIHLSVIETETSRGLAQAKVHVGYFGPGGDGEGQELMTQPDGTVDILEPADPTKTAGPNVFVVAEGHVPKVVAFQTGKVPLDYTLRLERANTLSGWVVDEQGQPVSGAEVGIESGGNIPGQSENNDFQNCHLLSQTDGTWSASYFPRTWTNEIRLTVHKAGYAPAFPVISVASAHLDRLALQLQRGYAIMGRITDIAGNPIPHAIIRRYTGQHEVRGETVTDADGYYQLTDLAGEADSYHAPEPLENDRGTTFVRGLMPDGPCHVGVAIQAPGYAPQAQSVTLTNATNHLDISLQPGHPLRVKLMATDGRPIPNALVQTDWDHQGYRAIVWRGYSDAEGTFIWADAPATEYGYWIEAAGYQTLRMYSLTATPELQTVVMTPVE